MPAINTNNADESKGRTLGMEGDNILILAASLLVALSIVGLLHRQGRPLSMKLVAGAAPVVVAAIWVFGFRQGKPPSYDWDCAEALFDSVLGDGPQWRADWRKQPLHPLLPSSQEEEDEVHPS